MRQFFPSLLLAAGLVGTATAQTTITAVPKMPFAFQTDAFGLSGDGKVAVGTFQNSVYISGFRYSRSSASNGFSGVGFSVSASDFTGATSVGARAGTGLYSEAAAWDSNGTMRLLNKNISGLGSAFSSGASSVCADGSVIVGSAQLNEGPWRAVRWGSSGDAIALTNLDGYTSATGAGVSADGSTIIGDTWNGASRRAFRWTASSGMTDLGTLSGSTQMSAQVVDASGSTIAGRWRNPTNGTYQVFRWSSTSGLEDLGTLQGWTGNGVGGISADGSIIVGGSSDRVGGGSSSGAFFWTRNLGMVNLYDYLSASGLNLSGWTLHTVTGISADGRTLLGNGQLNGEARPFIIDGFAVPTPAASVLLFAGGLLTRRRRN